MGLTVDRLSPADRLLEHFASSVQSLRAEARRTRELLEKHQGPKQGSTQVKAVEEKDAQPQ